MLRGDVLIQAQGPPNATHSVLSLHERQIFDAGVVGVHLLGNGKPIGRGAVDLFLKDLLAADLESPHQVFASIDPLTFNGHNGLWAAPAAQHVVVNAVSRRSIP